MKIVNHYRESKIWQRISHSYVSLTERNQFLRYLMHHIDWRYWKPCWVIEQIFQFFWLSSNFLIFLTVLEKLFYSGKKLICKLHLSWKLFCFFFFLILYAKNCAEFLYGPLIKMMVYDFSLFGYNNRREYIHIIVWLNRCRQT